MQRMRLTRKRDMRKKSAPGEIIPPPASPAPFSETVIIPITSIYIELPLLAPVEETNNDKDTERDTGNESIMAPVEKTDNAKATERDEGKETEMAAVEKTNDVQATERDQGKKTAMVSDVNAPVADTAIIPSSGEGLFIGTRTDRQRQRGSDSGTPRVAESSKGKEKMATNVSTSAADTFITPLRGEGLFIGTSADRQRPRGSDSCTPGVAESSKGATDVSTSVADNPIIPFSFQRLIVGTSADPQGSRESDSRTPGLAESGKGKERMATDVNTSVADTAITPSRGKGSYIGTKTDCQRPSRIDSGPPRMAVSIKKKQQARKAIDSSVSIAIPSATPSNSETDPRKGMGLRRGDSSIPKGIIIKSLAKKQSIMRKSESIKIVQKTTDHSTALSSKNATTDHDHARSTPLTFSQLLRNHLGLDQTTVPEDGSGGSSSGAGPSSGSGRVMLFGNDISVIPQRTTLEAVRPPGGTASADGVCQTNYNPADIVCVPEEGSNITGGKVADHAEKKTD